MQMAKGTYKGLKGIGRIIMKPVDKYIEKSKKMDEYRQARDQKMMVDNNIRPE